MKVWTKDPKSGKQSVTLTLLIVGFWICAIKLLMSNVTIGDISFEAFSGMDFAAALGALGALYGYRKTTDNAAEALVESDAIGASARLVRENKPPIEGEGK